MQVTDWNNMEQGILMGSLLFEFHCIGWLCTRTYDQGMYLIPDPSEFENILGMQIQEIPYKQSKLESNFQINFDNRNVRTCDYRYHTFPLITNCIFNISLSHWYSRYSTCFNPHLIN